MRNPVLYTANRVEGGFLNHTRRMSERVHSKTSERMDRATILHVSSQINVRISDKTTMKENQTGQKTVQLKRKFPFIHTICLNETNKKN